MTISIWLLVPLVLLASIGLACLLLAAGLLLLAGLIGPAIDAEHWNELH